MTERKRRTMYAESIPILAQDYEKRETPAAIWYRTATGQKYRRSKKTGNWKIIKGNLATFTKFIEKNLYTINIV